MNNNKTKRFYYFPSFVYDALKDMIMRNHGQAIVGIIIRLFPPMGGKLTAGYVKLIKSTLHNFSAIATHQGLPGLVKYLKVCSVCLQQSISGHVGGSPSSPRVSRTKSGIPRVFPAQLRVLIKKGVIFPIRLALTMLSIYRDFLYPGLLKTSSITNPSTASGSIVKMMIGYIPKFIKLFVVPASPTSGMRAWLRGRFSYFPINSSSPQAFGNSSTHPSTLYRSAASLSDDQIEWIAILTALSLTEKEVDPLTVIYDVQKDYQRRVTMSKTLYSPGDYNPYDWGFVAPDNNFWFSLGGVEPKGSLHTYNGKLGIKQEAAGKVRLFAMIDPWSQWALYPFHKGIFRILSKYPNIDGTFNQMRPLKRAFSNSFGKGEGLYSMDLSTATDRLPMAIQKPLISAVFGLTKVEGDAWSSLLVNRAYMMPSGSWKYFPKKEKLSIPSALIYAAGQPMGGYSSWPMLAITHHFIVQVAAWSSDWGRLNPSKIFTGYAVLGDDIVIYNKKVAKRYHYLIEKLGVECNLAKSITSPKGFGLEFAKRTLFNGMDVSPAPIKELFMALASPTAMVEYGRKYSLSSPQLVKVAGFGYRVISGCNKPFHKISNMKVRFLVFSDFLTNPKTATSGLRAKALGFSLNEFSRSLESFALNFSLAKADEFRGSAARVYGAWLAYNHPGYASGGVTGGLSGKLRSIWMHPLAAKMFLTFNGAGDIISEVISKFSNLSSPDSRITRAISLIQKTIRLEKDINIYSFDTFSGAKIDPISKRPGAPALGRLQSAWSSFMYGTKPFVRSVAMQQSSDTRMSGFIPIQFGVTFVTGVLGKAFKGIFFKSPRTTPIIRKYIPTIHRQWTNTNVFGIRTLFWFLSFETLYSFIWISLVIFILWVITKNPSGKDILLCLFPLWVKFQSGLLVVSEHMKDMFQYFHSLSLLGLSRVPENGLSYKFLIYSSWLMFRIFLGISHFQDNLDLMTQAWTTGPYAVAGLISGCLFRTFVQPFGDSVLYLISLCPSASIYIPNWLQGFFNYQWISEFVFLTNSIILDRPGNPMDLVNYYDVSDDMLWGIEPESSGSKTPTQNSHTDPWSTETSEISSRGSPYFMSPETSPVENTNDIDFSKDPYQDWVFVDVDHTDHTMYDKIKYLIWLNPKLSSFIFMTSVSFSLKLALTMLYPTVPVSTIFM